MPASGRLLLAISLVFGGAGAARAADAELPILLKEDFEHGMDRWRTTDPDPARGVWKIEEQSKAGPQVAGPAGLSPQRTGPDGTSSAANLVNHVLRVTGPSKYEPPYRSPLSIALLKDIKVGDMVLTARVQNTNPNAGPHRDLCFFWGYQDPSHYYYVHLGAKPDPAACQVFIVNGAPRTAITVDEAKGTPWTDGWHNVKVVRSLSEGTMAVYFDDMEKPLMTARDKTFGAGLVGIGTFDDNGNFDDVELRGEVVK